MNTHEIETARLRLRLFASDDVADFYQIIRDPDVKRFLADGEEFTIDSTRALIERFNEIFRARGYGRWAVVEKERGKLIGYCGLIVLIDEVGVELAYLLAKECWGRGLATEAARACLRYGFEQLGCERIAAISIVENAASKRVMERLRMSHVKNLNYFGRDCFHYAIARAEFRFDGSPYALRKVELPDDGAPEA